MAEKKKFLVVWIFVVWDRIWNFLSHPKCAALYKQFTRSIRCLCTASKSEYADVADIRIPPKYIWKPDLLMYNRYK